MSRRLMGLAVAWALLGPGPAPADTYPRQPGVDAVHYVFRLTLRDDTDEIAGEATADLRFVRDGVAEVALDLATAAGGKGMTVTGVTAGGAPVKSAHADGRLRLTVDPPAKAGERRRFDVAYRGVPADGLRAGPNRHADRTFFSHNWPDKARHWLPVIDHPSDKATGEFLVTAPARYQVVANGRLEEVLDLGDGQRRTHWKQAVPIPAWQHTVGAARFAVRHARPVRGVPLETWVFPQDRAAAGGALEGPARRAVELFGEAVGPYPYDKLALVQAVGMDYGGVEYASAVFLDDRLFAHLPAAGERAVAFGRLIAHEVAHQWFGDSVTEADWDDVWLSEGFATYFAHLYVEHYHGRDAFRAGLAADRRQVFEEERKRPGLAVVHDRLADTRQVLNGLVYAKGGWALHMLRGQVGPEAFAAGIREYYARHRDGTARTADFRRVMEEQSGQELGWFFDQWLRRPWSPAVAGGWRYDPAAKKVVIDLAQTQRGEPYRLPLEVGLTPAGGGPPRVERVELTKAEQRFELAADAEPAAVALDPDSWVLMQPTFAKR